MRLDLLRLAAVACIVVLASPFAAAGELLVLNKTDGTLDFVDDVSFERVARLATGAGPHEVALSPDGKLAVVCNYGTRTPGNSLSVYDTAKRELVRVIDLGEYRRPHGIQFEDADSVLVTAETNRAVVRVNVEKGEVEKAMPTDQEVSHMLVVSPDAKRVYTANIGSGSVSAIDLEKGELISVIETGEGAEGIDITPDGKELWVTNRAANTVSIVDTSALAVTNQLPCADFPIRVKITPNGEYALVSNPRSGDMTVFHVQTHMEVRRITMDVPETEHAGEGLFGSQFAGSPAPIGILITPDGKRAFVANTSADAVTLVDLKTWKVVRRIATGREPDGLGWIPSREK